MPDIKASVPSCPSKPPVINPGGNIHTIRNAHTVFLIGLVCAASGFLSPPLALAAGLCYGLIFADQYRSDNKQLEKFLLQASVVAIGFGMDLREVLRTGRRGFVYTASFLLFSLMLGVLVGRLFKVADKISFLISVGTAICGGSAIAAVSPIIEASEEDLATSLGTVFILNSVALLLFPRIGTLFRLSQEQFGLWSALAIHDTSSVVGATARYGPMALVVGTTAKLTRALWIVPLSLATAGVRQAKGRLQWPWFILLFVLAVVISTYVPNVAPVTRSLSDLGKHGMMATLYLIGAGLSRSALRKVGLSPLLQGILLWIVVASLSLFLILRQVISP